jgi:hypothetical protein
MGYGPYSPSKLDVAICPTRFYRHYLDPDRPREKLESVPQARGSAVHLILARITEELLRKRETFTDQDIRNWVSEAILQHPAAAEETGSILSMARRYLLNPPDFLPADAQVEQAMAIKMGERGFEECGYDDPNAYARGRIDIWMVSEDLSEATIIDHKTQPNIEPADTFQMGFYAWMMSKIHPYLQTIKTVLHFAHYGTYSKPYAWTKEALAEIEDEIITRIMTNDARTDWSPVANKFCDYCVFALECPIYERVVERDASGKLRPKQTSIKILGDTNKAVQLAEEIKVLDQASSLRQKELRAHVEASGAPIAIPGVIFGFAAKENVIDWDYANKYQRPQLYEIFEKHKVDPRHFMGFSQTFSSKIWQAEKPALSRELDAVLKRDTKTEFRARKV